MSKQTKKHEECQYFSDFLSKNLRYKNSKELWTINPQNKKAENSLRPKKLLKMIQKGKQRGYFQFISLKPLFNTAYFP